MRAGAGLSRRYERLVARFVIVTTHSLETVLLGHKCSEVYWCSTRVHECFRRICQGNPQPQHLNTKAEGLINAPDDPHVKVYSKLLIAMFPTPKAYLRYRHFYFLMCFWLLLVFVLPCSRWSLFLPAAPQDN